MKEMGKRATRGRVFMGGTELRAGPGRLRSPNAHHTLCAIPHRFYAIPLGKDFFAKKCARLSWIIENIVQRPCGHGWPCTAIFRMNFCRCAEMHVSREWWDGDDKKSNTQVD